MARTDQKVAVVTGAARSIGAAIAKQLARQGANVVVHHRSNSAAAQSLVRDIEALGAEALAVTANLSEVSQMKRLVSETIGRFGRVDILINNAATYHETPLGQIDYKESQEQFEINAWVPLFLTQEFLPYFPKSGGRIIHISSITASIGSSGMSVYAASKAALEAITRCHAQELGPNGITVNAVAPGTTETDSNVWLTDEIKEPVASKTALRRVGTAEDIARIVGLLATEESAWITGQVIRADGGYQL